MPEAVIVSTARSPIGRAMKGSLVSMRPDDLAVQIVRAALDKVPALNPHQIDDLILGCGQPGGESGFNLARVVAVELGFDFLPGTTVNRYCSSSLQTSRMAFHAIKAGEGDAFISAGVETVSRFPKGSADSWPDTKNPLFSEAQERSAAAAEGAEEWHDPRADGKLPDIYIAMGQTAENVALLTGISREDQDHWGGAQPEPRRGSDQKRVLRAGDHPGHAAGRHHGQHRRRPTPRHHVREDPRAQAGVPAQRHGDRGQRLPAERRRRGCGDHQRHQGQELGLTPLARIVSTGVSGLSPEIMGLGPIEATKKALARAKMSVSDIDLFEINEAFAVQVLGSARELGIDEDKLNVSGGAIALGHPFGMTGARITTTLLNNLQTHDKTFGLETMCVGGGQGMAMVIERLS